MERHLVLIRGQLIDCRKRWSFSDSSNNKYSVHKTAVLTPNLNVKVLYVFAYLRLYIVSEILGPNGDNNHILFHLFLIMMSIMAAASFLRKKIHSLFNIFFCEYKRDNKQSQRLFCQSRWHIALLLSVITSMPLFAALDCHLFTHQHAFVITKSASSQVVMTTLIIIETKTKKRWLLNIRGG